jgi:hypothetical protein
LLSAIPAVAPEWSTSKATSVMAAEIRKPDKTDPRTLVDSGIEAQNNLNQAGGQAEIEEVALDEGYHAAHAWELCEAMALRTYVSGVQADTSSALDRQATGISTRRVCQSTTPQADRERTAKSSCPTRIVRTDIPLAPTNP